MTVGLGADSGDRLVRRLAQVAFCHLRLELDIARELGLKYSHVKCLQEFAEVRELAVKRLVQDLEFSGSKVSRILDEMEDQKLLKREINAADRRSILVHLTPKGERLLAVIFERLRNEYEPSLASIPEDQLRLALHAGDLLIDHLAVRARPRFHRRPARPRQEGAK